MFQTKFEIELRCRECASVLTLSTEIYTDRGTSFVYVEPCPKCSAQHRLQADGLTICQNCGSWLRAGECENCNSPFAPAANA